MIPSDNGMTTNLFITTSLHFKIEGHRSSYVGSTAPGGAAHKHAHGHHHQDHHHRNVGHGRSHHRHRRGHHGSKASAEPDRPGKFLYSQNICEFVCEPNI